MAEGAIEARVECAPRHGRLVPPCPGEELEAVPGDAVDAVVQRRVVLVPRQRHREPEAADRKRERVPAEVAFADFQAGGYRRGSSFFPEGSCRGSRRGRRPCVPSRRRPRASRTARSRATSGVARSGPLSMLLANGGAPTASESSLCRQRPPRSSGWGPCRPCRSRRVAEPVPMIWALK